MIASALLALFALFATWADVPAPVDVPPAVHHAPHQQVATLGDSPTTPHHAPPVEARPLDPAPAGVPGCLPGEEWQGEFGCVAVQLDGETIGRAYG